MGKHNRKYVGKNWPKILIICKFDPRFLAGGTVQEAHLLPRQSDLGQSMDPPAQSVLRAGSIVGFPNHLSGLDGEQRPILFFAARGKL
jgi:hypothetical protein